MKILFWTAAALIAYAYAGYPVLLWMLARIGARRYRQDDAHEPTVSLLVPAYNEERMIAAKLENALSLDYPAGKLEILVASESDDGTDEAVERFTRREGPRVRLLPSRVRRGKVANLHRAVPEARGEILVFTDANAMFRPDALRKLVRHFVDPRVASVSGRLVYRDTEGTASARGERVYWNFEMLVKKASSDLGSLPGANGSLFALRRERYRPISETRGDDFELPIRAIIDGYASILELDAVSEEPATERFVHEYRRKVRIIHWMSVSALILLREALAAGRWLLVFQLLSHKLNRWMVPFWLLALLPASIYLSGDGSVYALAALAQALTCVLALAGQAAESAGLRAPRFLVLPLYFVVVNAASLVALLSCMTGREVRWHKRPDRAQ
ncbi:MAG TPA: glycosyltransferase family 2 protein [Candidatus Polarisedimenticolia bacterium]|jgi:cellulose synthase/poly-beta-1,6-N-acetylglucosamine synthase-like glycosyltransferase